MVVSDQSFVQPKRSVFNRVVADNHFELEFAAFLDGCDDIVSFAKNAENVRFKIEYQTASKGIANYLPDFVVKETPTSIWIIETKGREDVEDPHKWERLCQWCEDATAQTGGVTYKPLFVRQEDWERYAPKTFKALVETFGGATPRG
jgi:type III restriction enzyme